MPLIGTLTSGSLGAFGLAQQAQIAILKATTAISGSVPVSADWSTATVAHTLDNPNPHGTSENDQFGSAVAMSSTHAIVGTYYESDASGTMAGKAYIYNIATGALLYTLDNPNPYGTSINDSVIGNDRFGFSVAISDTYAIVGAYQEDEAGGANSGKAYIYSLSDGSLIKTLSNRNPDASALGDLFGFSVAISDTYAIVGAWGEDWPYGGGAAYIYDISSLSSDGSVPGPTIIQNASTDSNAYFGWAVALSDNYVIVSAPNAFSATGQAFVFNLSDGSLLYTFDNPNPDGAGSNDKFGGTTSMYHSPTMLAISDNYAIVGTPQEDDASGDKSGKAYVFDLSDGSLAYTLDNPNPVGTSTEDYFGMAVDLDDDFVIVGAPYEDDAVSNLYPGKAYIYNLTDGSLVRTLDDPNAFGTTDGDRFGHSVAINDGIAIVSASREDDGSGTSSNSSGKVYIFNAPEAAPAADSAWNINLADVTYVAEHNLTPPITANAFALTFSTDGTKLYVCGITQFPPRRDEVVQYSLSTAFDISTASYDNIKFNPSSQDTYPMGIAFNTDGTKMFLVGSGTHVVFQYSLSTPWDIGTASYDNLSISAGGAFGIHFNADGTKMYTIGYDFEVAGVRSFSLSTGFDLSTATDDLTSYSSIAVTGGNPYAAALNPDGTKMYILGYSNKSIYRYSLSTAFDVSTATYDNESISLDTELNTTYNMEISRDGTKIYVVGDTGSSISVLQFDTGL
jgi:hypothetical protein